MLSPPLYKMPCHYLTLMMVLISDLFCTTWCGCYVKLRYHGMSRSFLLGNFYWRLRICFFLVSAQPVWPIYYHLTSRDGWFPSLFWVTAFFPFSLDGLSLHLWLLQFFSALLGYSCDDPPTVTSNFYHQWFFRFIKRQNNCFSSSRISWVADSIINDYLYALHSNNFSFRL